MEELMTLKEYEAAKAEAVRKFVEVYTEKAESAFSANSEFTKIAIEVFKETATLAYESGFVDGVIFFRDNIDRLVKFEQK